MKLMVLADGLKGKRMTYLCFSFYFEIILKRTQNRQSKVNLHTSHQDKYMYIPITIPYAENLSIFLFLWKYYVL